MTTTPGGPTSDEHDDDAPDTSGTPETSGTPADAGAEIGITEGEGSTFEPEEDPEGHT